jgi:sec-independent protein translocase protein TatC
MIIYLLEIKNRFFFVLVSFVSVLFISYFYKEILLFLILKPCSIKDMNSNLGIFYFIFTDLTEILTVYIKLILFITAQITIVYFIYHCFIFFSFALFKKEYRFCSNLVLTCFAIWLFSLIIINYYLIPLSWKFFFSFHTAVSTKFISLHFEPKLKEYLNFCLSIYYNFILYSQLFVLLFIVNSTYNYNITLIKKYRKFYYFIFVVFSTFVSPPDIFSQLIISFGLIIVYEFSIIILIIQKLLIR